MELRDLKDQFNGRCFILGTGPSLLRLTKEDKAALDKEYTFGCSRYWRWQDAVGLKFYVVSEQHHVHQMRESGTNQASASIARFMLQWQPPQDDWVGLPVDEYRHVSVANSGLGKYPYVHQAVSETLIALQVAWWLGFNEFFFLGNECTRMGEVYDVNEQRGSDIGTMGSDFAAAARQLGNRLWDCTPGGELSKQGIVPYKDLSEVLYAA